MNQSIYIDSSNCVGFFWSIIKMISINQIISIFKCDWFLFRTNSINMINSCKKWWLEANIKNKNIYELMKWWKVLESDENDSLTSVIIE